MSNAASGVVTFANAAVQAQRTNTVTREVASFTEDLLA
jgi:hypothetical protein